jgi:ABC-type nitrate/sulfonate/bicarbonate transport system substrate-binding protein
MKMKISTLAAALALAALNLAPRGAAAEETLQINSFPSATNLPVWIGQHEGMFRRHGLTVELSHPAGSVAQFKGLMEGKYQVLFTALDNVVAYRDGHGEADTGGPVDLVGVMGLDSGFLTLIAAPGTKRIADLKGKVMAVDALTTGFSFALEELLARGGVAKDGVTYVTAGSSGARSKALQDGKAAAALLSMPFDLEATDKGFVALATVAGTLGHYQATVAAVRQGWARTHGETIVNFLRAYREAVSWLVMPAHKEAAIAILHEEMPNLDPSKLGRIHALLVDPRQGVDRDLGVDAKGAAMVLRLRARYAPAGAVPAGDWHRYVDLTWLKKSRK